MMTTVDTFPRYKVPVDNLSDLAHICLVGMKGKLSVESLIRSTTSNGSEVDGKDNEIANEKDKEAVQNQQVVDVNAAGNNLLVDAHREI
ncbi:hypothetical protein JG687_00018598 [Phytophthora cactorum]|uniref:Uncharacterized protein n=1 Tax=Phytophthora cactorum TaxID=29920 RepID=A0A8T1TLA9_9STRA|nr:hypothetical protein JG687_00018598 [Phytophthora cactorum]